MATVAESLFGVTPESLQRQRQQQLRQEAMDFASIADPFQQANFAIYQGAGGLARGIGGLLGAQDPEMMRVTQRQSLLQGVDPTSIESLQGAAQKAMEAQDFTLAQELAKRIQDMQVKRAGILKDEAAATASTAAAQASLAGKTPNEIQVANLRSGLVGAIRILKSQEQTPEVKDAIQQYQDRLDALPPLKQRQTQVVGVAQGSKVPVYEDDQGQFTYVKGADGKQTRQPYYGAVDRTTSTVNATAVSKADDAFSSTLGKGLAEKDLLLKDVAEAAPDALAGVKLTRDLLDSGRIFTGTGAGIKLNVLALGQSLGVTGTNTDEIVANTQQLQQQRSKAVLNQIKSSGLGVGQGFTDKDLAFLENASAGRITLSAETLRRQLDLEEKAFRASAKKWNDRVTKINPQLAASMGLSPVQIEATPPAGAAPKPTRRWNPATNQFEPVR